ncbi:MAG: FAD-dependent oxidoreductase, partial [Planctomycetota bacterium]
MSQEDSQLKTKSPLVVVGAGMAAYELFRRLADAGALPGYSVTVVGEEPRPCYDRVNLTECFSAKQPDDLLLASADWYAENDIQLLTNVRVAEIDRQQRVIKGDDGREIPYQHLVLATGSTPFVPPIAGTDLEGVFVYRTIEDIDAIKAYAPKCSSAAVLGGGLLGLEAGKALYDLKLDAHVIEMAAGLMPRQLNADAATLLKQEVESLGVNVHVLRRTESIEADGDRRVINFHGHDPLEVDMVVISAGIRPRDDLARAADLEIGPRGGIVVDDKLATSDPQIYAIGECVCFDQQL